MSEDSVIVEARITDLPTKLTDPLPKVIVKTEDSQEEVELFDFYPDEVFFFPNEFIGKTIAEAHDLKSQKDRARFG